MTGEDSLCNVMNSFSFRVCGRRSSPTGAAIVRGYLHDDVHRSNCADCVVSLKSTVSGAVTKLPTARLPVNTQMKNTRWHPSTDLVTVMVNALHDFYVSMVLYTTESYYTATIRRDAVHCTKGAISKWGHRRGSHHPLTGLSARRWVGGYTYDAWSGHHQTYSHLPSLGVSPPFDRYQIILLVDRGTRV